MISLAVGISYLGFYAPPPVAAGTVTPVFLTMVDLPVLFPTVPYLATLTAEGGDPPYAFALKAGSGPLPPGIAFSTDGVFSGTAPALAVMLPDTVPPATVDLFYHQPLTIADLLYPFTVRVNDSVAQIDEQDYVLALWRNPTTLSLVSGRLPPCLSFGGDGLGGKATQAGTFPITVRATDADGRTLEKTYTLVVASPRIDP